MFDNFALYLMLLAALGIGFVLGRRDRRRTPSPPRRSAERYFAGFNQLVDEQRDLDLDSFVESMVEHNDGVETRLAHFQCELATAALAVARAARFDPGCARVNLVGADVELAGGRYRDACRALRRAVQQDPDCVPLAVAGYRVAAEAQGDAGDYVAFLEACLELGAFLPAVRELADHLERTGAPGSASDFVIEQLLRSPSLGGFVALLEHLDRDGKPLDRDQLALVQQFSRALLERQSVYRCGNCGFSSHGLMWQCPSCHEWGSARPIAGRAAPG